MIEQRQPPLLFFINLLTVVSIAIANSTITSSAGLYISSELGGSISISVYSVVFFGLGTLFTIPLAHPLADRIGSIKALVYSLISFAAISLLCATAPIFFLFNLYRTALGASGGFLYILCRRLVADNSAASSISIYHTLIALSFAISPVVGGCFGAWLGYEGFWRWIFYLNLPVALFFAAYFWFYFKDLDSKISSVKPFDKVGYFFFSVGVAAFVTVLTLAQQLDWYRSTTLMTLAFVAVISLVFFVLWELNHPDPAIELKLLRHPMFLYAVINLAVLFAIYFGMITLITLWLHIYVNYTPLWISVLLGTMGVAGIFGYFLGRYILHYFDPRVTLAAAIIAFASSCYYSTYFDVDIDFFHLAIARSLAGLGIVLFLFPIFKLAYAAHIPGQNHNIFCLLQLTRSLFSSLGAVLFVTLWERRHAFFHERLGEGLTPYSQLTSNFFHRAEQTFNLMPGQSTEQLNIFLDKQTRSLALNDAFGFMGYVLLGLLLLLVLSFLLEKIYKRA